MGLRFFTFVTFFLVVQSAFCQSISGTKYYLFSRNRMLQFSFDSTRIITRQLDWNFQPYELPEEPDTMFIADQIAQGDGLFFICHSGRMPNSFTVQTFGKIYGSHNIILSITAKDTSYGSAEDAKKTIQPEQRMAGPTLYSQQAADDFKRKPSIDKMTASDFNRYVNKIVQGHRELDSLDKSGVSGNGIMYFGYAKLRQYAVEVGYNPLFTSKDFEAMLSRFKKDPRTKDACNRIYE